MLGMREDSSITGSRHVYPSSAGVENEEHGGRETSRDREHGNDEGGARTRGNDEAKHKGGLTVQGTVETEAERLVGGDSPVIDSVKPLTEESTSGVWQDWLQKTTKHF